MDVSCDIGLCLLCCGLFVVGCCLGSYCGIGFMTEFVGGVMEMSCRDGEWGLAADCIEIRGATRVRFWSGLMMEVWRLGT